MSKNSALWCKNEIVLFYKLMVNSCITSQSLWDLRTIPLWSKWTKDLTLYCLYKIKEIMILLLQNSRKPVRQTILLIGIIWWVQFQSSNKVSNNTWIYVYIKKLDKISTPIPTPTPESFNSNSNSNSGSFNSNSNSNSGQFPEYQLQLQLQLREFQLQLQLRQVSWMSTPTPTPEVSTPIPTPTPELELNPTPTPELTPTLAVRQQAITWTSLDPVLYRHIVSPGHNELRFMFTWLSSSRDHFVYVPSQWEATLQCNVVSHWLGTYTKWSLILI